MTSPQPPLPDPRDLVAAAEAPVEAPRRAGITPITLLLVLIVAYVLVKVQLVLILVLLAVLFATVIERPVLELQRRRVPRGLSILAVYIAIIGSIALASVLVAPVISDEADNFRAEAPEQLRELQDSWQDSSSTLLSGAGADLLERAITQIEEPSSPSEEAAIGIATGVVGGVVGLLAVLVMAFYYLMEKSFLRGLVIHEVSPASRERVSRVWDSVEAQVGRWLRGQLTLCLIIGTLSLIGYGTMGVRFWPLLGLWAGLTEIIPIVGPWIGGIPAVIIAMTQSWDKALMVTGFVVALQLLENTILVPRVMKGAVGLTPLTVFIAILVGTEYMNVAGALLAIPVAAAVQVIAADYLRTRRGVTRTGEPALPNWRWMRGQFGLVGQNAPPATPIGDPPPNAVPPTPSPASWTSQILAQVGGEGKDGEAERRRDG